MLPRPLSSALALSICAVLARAQAPTFDDVVIGTAPLDAGGTVAVRMDVWKPADITTPTPVVLWIHGGGWSGGDHNQPPPSLSQFLARGFSVASIDYRVSQEAIFPAQIHDVKGAVRFLRANAATYGIDPAHVVCFGPSAGGHLSALLATSGGVAALEGTTGGNASFSSRVSAAVDYFGPTDIVRMSLDVTTPPGTQIDHDAPDSGASMLVGFDGPGEGIGVLRANFANPAPPFPALAALADSLNPITHVTNDDPPVFVAHGTSDTVVPLHQSQRLVTALETAQIDHVWIQAVGAGHGPLGATTEAAMLAFLTLRVSDCNANDVLDAIDLANGVDGDANGDGILDGCDTTSTGTLVCFGDGSGTACPCGNTSPVGANAGCRNSLGVGGRVVASGTASLAQDGLLLSGSQMPSSSALYFQGSFALNAGAGVIFGDGLRCAGGAVIRLATLVNSAGVSSYPTIGAPAISVRGQVLAPSTRWYQVWYRNAAPFCTATTFNLTNAVRIVWTP